MYWVYVSCIYWMYESLFICFCIYLLVYSDCSNCIAAHCVDIHAWAREQPVECYSLSLFLFFLTHHYRRVETCLRMYITINVHENGRVGKWVHKLAQAYLWNAGVRRMNIQMEKGSRHMNRVMSIKKVSIRFVQQETDNQKGGCQYRTEHKTYIWIWRQVCIDMEEERNAYTCVYTRT